jgi:TonB family protein
MKVAVNAEELNRMIVMMGRVVIVFVLTLVSLSSLHAQSLTPAAPGTPLKAIYTPQPAYQAEWVKRGLKGKGIVLVTIDKDTGQVTGAQMFQSTGSKELDGSALEAYSRWRFPPGTVSQVKIPVEFRNRPPPQASKQTLPKPAILYPLLIFLGLGALVMVTLKRRKHVR